MKKALLLSLSILLGASFQQSCTKKKKKSAPAHHQAGGDPEAGENQLKPRKDGALIWKRYRAFEQGLMGGLELSKNELCSEVGSFNCIDQAHLTVLGGNEPFANAQHERPGAPSALTAVAVSRVLMSACSKRADLDQNAGASASVFKSFSLAGPIPDDNAVKELTVNLYQRLLARDPEPKETEAVVAAKAQFSDSRALAVGICYAIGTHIENIFL